MDEKFLLQKKLKRKRWLIYRKLITNNVNFKKPKDYKKLKRYFSAKRKNKIEIEILNLPAHINLQKNINEMIQFTDNVKKLSNYPIPRIKINHKLIKEASVGGIIYILGQVDYLVNIRVNSNNSKLSYSKKSGLPNDEKLKYIFYKIGYWDYFKISKPYKITKETEDKFFLKIHTDTMSKFTLLNDLKFFIKERTNILDDYEIEYKFDDAVKEALGNTLEHAYPIDFNQKGKTKNKWWACAFYDKNEKFLEVIFYDYGVGIRESIKRNLNKEADRNLLDKIKDEISHDGKLLEIALKGTLSKYKGYKERDRGKGFKRFNDFARTIRYNCNLIVISGNGMVKITYNKQEEFIVKKFNGKLDGMLIKWQIFLKEK